MARTIRLIKGAQFRNVAATPEGTWASRWYEITRFEGDVVIYESDTHVLEYGIHRTDLTRLARKGYVEFAKGS